MTNFRCLFAIFSHGSGAQVLRLVRTLRALSPRSEIVVHHDPSHQRLLAADVEAAGGRAVPAPVAGEWGDFSLVEQHLHTMRWCAKNFEFDWYLNLTGQTYPIRPLDGLERELRASPMDAWLDWFDAYDPAVWPAGEAARRYHYRYWKLPRFRYWHRLPPRAFELYCRAIETFNRSQNVVRVFRLPRSLPTRLGLASRQRPFSEQGRQLFGANLNMNFSRRALERILARVDEDPGYCAYFRRTVIPDEVFFPTLLCNEPDMRVGKGNLRHIHWPPGNAASGAVLTLENLPEIENSSAYFALKFDQNACPELLDYIDRRLGLNQDT